MKDEDMPEAMLIDTLDLNCEKMLDPTMQQSIPFYFPSLTKATYIQFEEFRDKMFELRDFHFPLKPLEHTNDQNSNDPQVKAYFQESDYHFSQYFKHDPHQNRRERFWCFEPFRKAVSRSSQNRDWIFRVWSMAYHGGASRSTEDCFE